MNWIRPILVAAGVGCGLVGQLQAQTTGIFADVATSLGTFSLFSVSAESGARARSVVASFFSGASSRLNSTMSSKNISGSATSQGVSWEVTISSAISRR